MYTKELSKEGGFDFSLHDRNTKLGFNDKVNVKKFTKTGTTICAVQHKDGVVFGADTRATAGTVVMDLECTKLHELSNSIMCAGAGTAADLFATINMVSSELQLLSMNTGNSNRINHVEHRLSDYLFRHGGHVGCALIFGGFDVNGAQIVSIIINN